ncbi:MAG: S8 family serine peptidase [Actinomycetota bacterium]|nr:S8 family serine peptidase [Actinomycetota bacterium]
MARDYIILRDLQAATTNEPFGGGPRTRGARPRALVAPEPRIEVESLDAKDVREIARDPEVAAISRPMPTRLVEPFEADATGAAAGQDAWGISVVGADVSSFTGAGTVVSVLDTGIDSAHPAFAGVTLVQQDFSGSGNGDVQGHGSHCAGTIFGRDVDGARIGVALGVERALIGKVLGDDGSGSSEMLFSGIQWAVEGGANVISMSLGFDFPGLVSRLTSNGWPVDLATSVGLEAYRGNLRMFDALMDLIQAREAFGPGTVVVAAAGNESKRQERPDYEIAASLPAAAEGVVSVGALGQDGGALSVAPFSNTFPQMSAPGVDIKSVKVGGGTRNLNGTSMACPHVAGVAALWWESVRSSPVPPNARTVVAKLLASARTDVFAQGVEVADRGVGLVKAP